MEVALVDGAHGQVEESVGGLVEAALACAVGADAVGVMAVVVKFEL